MCFPVTIGDYPNQSKYVYVDLDEAVREGAMTSHLSLPFGYFCAPRYSSVVITTPSEIPSNSMIHWNSGLLSVDAAGPLTCSGSVAVSGTLTFPDARLRVSASDGGLADARNAYFGMSNTRTAASTRADLSVGDVHGMLDARFLQSVDHTSSPPRS